MFKVMFTQIKMAKKKDQKIKKQTKDASKDAYSVWDNPMVASAKKNLSKEDLERYERLGQSLYGKIDYKQGQVANDLPPEAEALAYIEESLKSGLHPSMLEDDEKSLLEHTYGDSWLERWGYVKEDLNDIVTVKK